ncbi:UPF0728 protein-like [Lingula anatina]|uniref:UPF0728 protein n=1 Tax=Lingula anatina TaxID=7574 RepID=A0A1S3I2I6_LINAN|nr:UPF0728 protein [Lingula anatina]XP_013392480.1 UPF0728 protein-like [Lingula anatina]|eukprot:XP_013392463.1 UPF0728 protein [Lingula anatina]
MPENARVVVCYGPYESCGVVDHREERLQGLQTVLTRDGHQVDLQKMADHNTVQLYVNGELIFTCNIKDLEFGGDGQLDSLCAQALDAVKKAF